MSTGTGLRPFDEIFAIAAARKGGAEAFEASLPVPTPPDRIARLGDDRWLSEFSRRVFQSGFNWKVVDDKWPRFEEVFHGFDIGRNAMMSDDDLDAYLKTDGIVRHAKKILSIRDNAVFLKDLAAEQGGAAGPYLARWPEDDFLGLVQLLRKRGSRLGGITGLVALRGMGKDGYMLGGDVVKALIREGVVAKEPTSKRDLEAVQAAFNHWRAESGRPLMQISRTLACSVE